MLSRVLWRVGGEGAVSFFWTREKVDVHAIEKCNSEWEGFDKWNILKWDSQGSSEDRKDKKQESRKKVEEI